MSESTEPKEIDVIIPTRKEFKLKGENTELFISFGVQQRIVNLYGGLDNINLLYTDPIIQTQATAIVIFNKGYNAFDTVEDIYEALSDYDSTELNPVMLWLQAYFINFTLAQAEKMQKTVTRTQATLPKIQKG